MKRERLGSAVQLLLFVFVLPYGKENSGRDFLKGLHPLPFVVFIIGDECVGLAFVRFLEGDSYEILCCKIVNKDKQNQNTVYSFLV